MSQLQEELARLKEETKDLRDKYLRACADLDNYRKRTEREMRLFRETANADLLSGLIPVIENLDRALAVNNTQSAESVRAGVEIVRRQLQETLAQYGMVEYSGVGEPFDPQRHEAVGTVETDEQPPDTVVAESAQGYLLGGRVLRAARVLVARAKRAPGAAGDKQKEEEHV